MHCRTIISLLLLGSSAVLAQPDSLWRQKPEFQLSAFAEIFYAYDFGRPTTPGRHPFLYNYNRHNTWNLNLGVIRLHTEHPKFKTDFALQAGTYVEDNYATEPAMLKLVHEAHCAISLNKKNSIWIDTGIFPSHIGFESAQSTGTWTLTRSLAAENSPYFLSGMKVNYHVGNRWRFSGVLCNGWQRIQRISGNSGISIGSQVQYTPSAGTTLNWSTFIGSDDPDSTRRMRVFNDVYAILEITPRIGFQTCFHIGFQQSSKGSKDYLTWFSHVLIIRYAIHERWDASFRSEYYQDDHRLIIAIPETAFRTWANSLNLDLTPSDHLTCRLEGRWMHCKQPIFKTDNVRRRNNVVLTGSIAFRL